MSVYPSYYKESHKILGQTFGFLVLQDYEAITPNLLARTIETVEGGGVVCLLLKNMSSLKQLYTMSMDVHSRYRTENHTSVQPRFNERFILSLGSNPSCLVLDDELNVLPISAGKDIVANPSGPSNSRMTAAKAELTKYKAELRDTPVIGPLTKLCATTDQLKALLSFVSNGITSKQMNATVSLTSGRGRGKSAALGLAIASAVAHDYSNIFVTSPTPENLKTLFEFVKKGLDALGYEETLDYDFVRTGNEDWGRAVVRVNIFKGHRQTIQYIQPEDSHVLGQAELVIIDEAAAIPLPLVRKLLGPYLVFMASTINGYEGTGRSLSIKLIQQLREQTRPVVAKESAATATAATTTAKSGMARTLAEIKLEQPIRYGSGDPVEKWLNALLCLDATTLPRNISGCPHPSQCELYYVNRDTLFSYHPASEVFLQRMMALYVASHYKNTPNDLQLMSDAPAHHLFVLLPPLKEDESTLPDPLVVVQVALEGNISRENIMTQLAKGVRSGGDLIPWLVSQQFQDDDFAMLSGARVVRIATHPDYARMGYGARALESLNSFYSGDLLNLDEAMDDDQAAAAGGVESFEEAAHKIAKGTTLQSDHIGVRDVNRMPPLLQRLSERRPEQLDYLGVSYGLTKDLLRFWKRAGYAPLYIRQTTNELTGEHTCVMLKTLNSHDHAQVAQSSNWLAAFSQDFRKRFLSLLSYKFREFEASLALSVIEAASAVDSTSNNNNNNSTLPPSELDSLFTPFDLKRIDSYSNNMLDYHVILDLLPSLATLFFTRRLGPHVSLAAAQQAILLALGLQRKTIDDVEKELGVPVNQGLALFVKVMRKFSKSLHELQKQAIGRDVPEQEPVVKRNVPGHADKNNGNGDKDEDDEDVVGTRDWKPMKTTVAQDLEQVVNEETKQARAMQRELIDSMDLSQ